MSLFGELCAGAALETLFAELYKAFKELRDDTKCFGGRLEILSDTLESLKPLIEDLQELNLELNLPNEQIEEANRMMTDGKELVDNLRKMRKRDYLLELVKRSYNNQLVELDRSLKTLVNKITLQQARDFKYILLEMRKYYDKILKWEEHHHIMVEKLYVRREPWNTKGLLSSAVESSKQIIELAASTRLLLGNPVLQRQAKNVEEARILVTSTEKALERIFKENGVLHGLPLLVQRTAVGTILHELFDALYKVKGKYLKLELLQPMIEDMQAKYNKALDHPREELEIFKMLVKKALDLLRSKLCAWISYRKHKYRDQLLEILDKSLRKLLDILTVMGLSNSTTEASV